MLTACRLSLQFLQPLAFFSYLCSSALGKLLGQVK
jgi:hypothetical protein